MTASLALFETGLGVMGIAWAADIILGTTLPEATADLTRARMIRRFPQATERPAAGVAAAAVLAIQAYSRGEVASLDSLPLEMRDHPAFDVQVWLAARAIPAGETRTYGDIARQLGDVHLSQRVGQALGRNPFAPIIPCHRILGAQGRMGGFSAGGGTATKLQLLNLEQARTGTGAGLFDALPLAVKPS
jgi:methylated-DNA-[protein]-cysteine S-methyltransferase